MRIAATVLALHEGENQSGGTRRSTSCSYRPRRRSSVLAPPAPSTLGLARARTNAAGGAAAARRRGGGSSGRGSRHQLLTRGCPYRGASRLGTERLTA